MKNHFLALALLLSSYALFAQSETTIEENPSNKFELSIIPKLGYARIAETGNVPVTGVINAADFLIAVKLGKKQMVNVSTGLGYFEFWGNRSLDGNTSSLRNAYLHIPLNLGGNIILFKKNKPENQKVFFAFALGLYGNNQIKQEAETISGTYSDSNLGWNLGFSSQIGIKFTVSDILNLGIGYESQTDITKMKKDNIERNIQNASTINFTLGFKL